MTKVWQKLYDEAMSVLNPREISPRMWCGSVASALITKKGNIYKGICVDTDSSLGMCAERNAISTMLTYGECEIDKILSVYRDGKIIPSCGACREFMIHLGESAKDIEMMVDSNGRIVRLYDLMPEYPNYK